MGLLIAPPVAVAEWLPAVDISAEGEFGFEQAPQVAVGASGDAVAVWPQLEGHYVIQASTKNAGGTWGPPVDISPPGEESTAPQVAMNASGDAVAIWAHWGTIKGANRTPQGSWRAADGLSVPGGDLGFLDVAIDPVGRAVAIWTRMRTNTSDYVIEAADRSPAGQWGPPVQLSESGNNAWSPQLAVDSSGHTVAVWSRWNDQGDTIVQAAEKDPGEAWSETVDLSLEGGRATLPAVAVRDERAVVAWERNQVVETTTKAAGRDWQEPVEISGPGSGEPAVGMDSDGNALAVWSFEPEVGQDNAKLASLPVGGKTWTKPITLSKRLAGEWAAPKVAVDPAGRAMAIWTAWDGTARVVEAASGTVGGSWGSPVTISPPGSWSQRTQVAMDSAGNAAAVWEGEPLTMQAALFDVTKPELSSVSIPSLVRAGRPISFAASPFDAWSPVSPVSWTFGDASTAVGPSVIHSFQEAGQFHVTVTTTDAAGHSTTASGAVNVTPALAISDRVVTVRNGRAHLKLLCPGTAVCHGNARLTRRAASKKSRGRSRSIGETEFAIPAKARMTVVVKLKPKGLNLFSATPKTSLHARLTGDAVESRTIVLKPVAPRPHRR